MSTPDERQRRILPAIRELLAKQHPVSELKQETHYKHWEDEDLGNPPLGESVAFSVGLPPFVVWIGTAFPWEESHIIKASFRSYDDGKGGETPWALLKDGETARALESLGFDSSDVAKWPLADATDDRVIADVAAMIEKLAALPVRLLRPSDLPPNTPWPWSGLVQVMAGDEISDLAPAASAERRLRVSVSTAGNRRNFQISDDDYRLVRWWRDGKHRGSLRRSSGS